MIISHSKKIIFFKTAKVGGTSFEIALRGFCSTRCIITPISVVDEKQSEQLGFRGPQNYENTQWDGNLVSTKPFYNHITYDLAKPMIPEDIWNSYSKIAIHRNPFDVIVSKYYWIQANSDRISGKTIDDYVRMFPEHCLQNLKIAPLDKDLVIIKYENMYEDLERNGLDFLIDNLDKIKAKSGARPEKSKNLKDIFKKNEYAKNFILGTNKKLIAALNYEVP